jgi:tetratricopeptide (TPR) repeat protein
MNLGVALSNQGAFDEAVACCRRALELRPDDAAAHSSLGVVMARQERFEEAVACYRRAIELRPDLVEAHNDLAAALKEQNKLDEAAACCRRALELRPDFAKAYVNLAVVLTDQNKLDEAVACYRRALELKPDFADAYINLGGLHEELGELAEAEASFRAALRVQPDSALPHARLAEILRGKLPAADLASLERRLADPELDRGPRARLLFALAHALDAHGDYGRAADCLRQANALTVELARGRCEYDPAEHDRFVEGLMRVFDREFFARVAGAGSDTRRPVFVFGLPRSGTTLIEQVLASHSRVHGAGELQLARQTIEAMPAMLASAKPPLDCVADLDAAALNRLAEQHLDRLREIDGGRAERIVDKMPDNYLFLGLLAALFPRATLIHCRRDLRDVAVSCWMTDFPNIQWANDLEHIASHFRQYCRLMEHWRAVLPVAIHEIDYEDVVADMEPVARKLLAACGLEWEPACLEFHRTRRRIRTASVIQVRQPIYRQSVARWKHYERALADLFASLPRQDERPPIRTQA